MGKEITGPEDRRYICPISQNLDNELIKQKDRIIKMINAGYLTKADIALSFIKPLWVKFDYGYKYHELRERMKAERLRKQT